MRTVIQIPQCPKCNHRMAPHPFDQVYVCLFCMLEHDLIMVGGSQCEFVPVWTIDEVLEPIRDMPRGKEWDEHS